MNNDVEDVKSELKEEGGKMNDEMLENDGE